MLSLTTRQIFIDLVAGAAWRSVEKIDFSSSTTSFGHISRHDDPHLSNKLIKNTHYMLRRQRDQAPGPGAAARKLMEDCGRGAGRDEEGGGGGKLADALAQLEEAPSQSSRGPIPTDSSLHVVMAFQ